MIRVLACTRGRDVPSARFRVQQYREVLRAHGVELVEAPARLGGSPPRSRAVRPAWGVGVLAERTVQAARSWRYDVTLLQREMISTLLTVERFTKAPRLLDIDDAIWLSAGPRFTQRIARLADRVVAGNDYIADWFSRWTRDVVVIPTAVDTARFAPDPAERQPGLIGWTGRSSGLRYLYDIEPALEQVFCRNPGARLRVVSERAPQFRSLPADRVEFVPWSRAGEVRLLQQMNVGLMPLPDDEWERGKCSYKMLLYAACGVPSVVSPVGMNRDVLAMGDLGLAAASSDDWIDAIDQLLRSPADVDRMGAAGRRVVCERFSVDQWGPRLAQQLIITANGSGRMTATGAEAAVKVHDRT